MQLCREPDGVVKLDSFVVGSARDTNAASIAINEQRFAPNIKNIVSADALGDVMDGNVGEFLKGARSAYEMILMAFERGELASVKPFLSQEVYLAFLEVIEGRKEKGLSIDANFVGLAEIAVHEVEFDEASREADVAIRFLGELTSVVRDAGGEIVEGSLSEIKRQKDIWTFSRVMGSDDPNWQLVATGE